MGDLMHCLESIADSPKDLFIKDLCNRTPIAQGVCLSLFLFMWILQLCTFHLFFKREGPLIVITCFSHILRSQSIRCSITARGK
jgi:hypothetical protein